MPSKPDSEIAIRPGEERDIDAIVQLVVPFARQGIVLPRTDEDIREHLPNFLVAERDNGEVVGCVALRDFGDGLEEIRTLIVHENCQGDGLGTRLIRAAMELAHNRATTRVFALTIRPSVFANLGFQVVPKTNFPAKVWSDCRFCPKRDYCDETAVVLPLTPAATRS